MATLIYSPISCLTELLGLLTMLHDMNELLEAMLTFTIACIQLIAIYNLYFNRDKLINVLDTLNEMIALATDQEQFRGMILSTSKKIITIIWFLYISALMCAIFYLFKPLWYKKNFDARELLVFNSWYPYDQNKYPYYEISYVIECFRMVFYLHTIIGSDSIFMMILIYIIEQYSILATNFKDIFKNAEKNISENEVSNLDEFSHETCLKQEVHKLMKQNVEQHIKLNE